VKVLHQSHGHADQAHGDAHAESDHKEHH
jgi:hypothetical protein